MAVVAGVGRVICIDRQATSNARHTPASLATRAPSCGALSFSLITFSRSVATSITDLPYLRAYPATLQDQVRERLAASPVGLSDLLLNRYPQAHAVRTDKALYQYTAALKSQHLRHADTIQKVVFDSKIHAVRNALGLHTSLARVQGGRLSARHEIRIGSMFKQAPEEFLRMIVVHELAHLREKSHDKAFYQLCEHMEPRYHQYEFDVRLYLTHVEHSGQRLWSE